MHEASIAASLLEIIEETIGGTRPVRAVRVTIGPLAGIDPEALIFCFTEIAEESGFGRPELIVNAVPARATCRNCGKDYEFTDVYTLCPHCESFSRTINRGDEFTLDWVEAEEAAETGD